MTKNHPDIQQAVDSVRVIDTHEHLEEESVRLARKLDFVSLFTLYGCDDLAVAGMPAAAWERCIQPDTPLDEKWQLSEPYYLAARNTAYLKSVEIAIRDLYEIESLDARTFDPLTERMRERNQPGVLRWILREQCGIDLAQVNDLDAPFIRARSDSQLFQQDLCVKWLLNWPPPVEQLEHETGVTINSFRSYADAIDALFDRHARRAAAVKQQSAYWRVQRFEEVPNAAAEKVFSAAVKGADGVDDDDRRRLEDWAFHRCIRLAIEHDLPIKIHTGYNAGHDCMNLAHVRPADLTNLFIAYPKARFDLFHIGYPYQSEVIALAKHFSNVYVDLCWTWIIDPQASRQFLKQFLTAVPASKLFAFGGDFIVAEPVYGHLRMARDGIASVLSELVEESYFTVDEATEIVRRILRENAMAVFNVDAKRAAV